jgi:hypothetical protein
MKLSIDGERLVLDDTPWGRWVLGSLCAALGLAVLVVPLLADDWTVSARVLIVLLLALPFLAGGVLLLRLHPATRTTFDRGTGDGRHVVTRPGTAGAVATAFRVADVRTFDLVRSTDDEGDTHVQLRLWLAESRALLLQARAGTCSERQADDCIQRTKAFLQLPA